MRYIIDGYNLMFRILRAGNDITKQREEIIQQLSEMTSALSLDATIVFDAQYQQEDFEITHINELRILFTNQGQIADDLICQLLKREKNPRSFTVVTSDNRLAWRVRRLTAQTQKVEDFFSQIRKRYKNRLTRKENKHKRQMSESLLKPDNSDLEEAFQEKKPEPILTDFDRWLKIFEERIKKQIEE